MYLLKPSFAGGELSPALYGRTDLAKYDSGAAKLLNFMVLRYGGVANRPGTHYIAQTAGGKKAVLLPFRYNTEQNYVIEFTAGKIRFYTGGAQIRNADGSVYEINSPYAEGELDTIKYTQSADVMFLAQPNHPPMTLSRYSDASWKLEEMDINGGPFEDAKKNTATISASGVSGTVTLTASGNIFSTDHVGTLINIDHYVDSQYKKGVPIAHSDGQGGTIPADDLTVEVLPQASVYVESFGFWDGNFILEKYNDTTDKWEKLREQSGNRSSNYNLTEKNESSEIKRYRVTSTEFNIDVWENENDKQRGFVTIQAFGNDYSGQVRITKYISATQVQGVVKRRLASTAATKDYAFGAWSVAKGYPTCVGFFEDRLIFAGTKSKPQTIWASKTGDYPNFGVSIPQTDDDAVTATLNGGQMNGIKAMVAFGELIMLTAGGEYKINGGGKAMSPTNIQTQAQEYRGISDVLPVVVGNRIVYVQQQGTIIRDLAYNYQVDKYTGDDINLLASHLFQRHKIKRMTYQQTPDSIVWCVRDDGTLLGLTYLKEQEVYAWHEHTTQGGRFVDVCSISNGKNDELWCVVERGGKHYVELMAQREMSTDAADQYFVDAGVTFSGAKTDTLTGLDHLEGQEVAILADGNELPRAVVQEGKLKLKHAYGTIHVGLPIDAQVVTLPIEFSGQDGTYQSRRKRIPELMIYFKDSRGGLYGTNMSKLDEIKWRSTERYGEAIKLYTGKQKLTLPNSTWSNTVQCIIKQDSPLPLTILSIVPQVDAGG